LKIEPPRPKCVLSLMTKAIKYIGSDQYLFANQILSVEEIAPKKFILKFEKHFDFKAGHVVALAINRSHDPRIYSVCSGVNEPEMQILFDLKEEGLLTPKLSSMKVGTRIFVSKPYGSFLPTYEIPMWWIATGTGIAPFYSMLRSGFRAEKLLHGCREGSQFYFEREFKHTLKENYLRCSSGKNGIGDFFGRVTSYLGKNETLPKHNKYYLCGRSLMVVEVRDLLISKGIPYENIKSEIYF
jgi:ferredoxin/flavodoxin---NADP+ reductase